MNKHFCFDCFTTVVGPVQADRLMELAKETNLNEEDFWLLLQTANLAYAYSQGEESC